MTFAEARETVLACLRLSPHAMIFMFRDVERGHPDWGFIFAVGVKNGVSYVSKFNREFAYMIRNKWLAQGSYASAGLTREALEADDWDVEVFPEITQEVGDVQY